MVSKDDLIAWSIKRYKEDGGDGIPDADASSVLPIKVQVRNVNGDLLKEYDKDFVEFKVKDKGKRASQYPDGPNPKFALFALAAAIAIPAGLIIYFETTSGTGGGPGTGGGWLKPAQKETKILKVFDNEACVKYIPNSNHQSYLEELLREGYKVTSTSPAEEFYYMGVAGFELNPRRAVRCVGAIYTLEK